MALAVFTGKLLEKALGWNCNNYYPFAGYSGQNGWI
jgi:hypothetical protein